MKSHKIGIALSIQTFVVENTVFRIRKKKTVNTNKTKSDFKYNINHHTKHTIDAQL